MNILSKKHRVLSTPELEDVVRKKAYHHKDFVFITFDDGYLNNLTVATEIIKEFNLPSTLFISTGYIGNSNHIWTDFLEDFFLNANQDEILSFQKHIVSEIRNDTFDRIAIFNESRRYLKTTTIKKRNDILCEISTQLPTREGTCEEFHAFLNWEEIRQMKDCGLWTFGSHTVNHNPLTKLGYDEMLSEVTSSFQALEDRGIITGSRYFAYPEGQPSDMSQMTRSVLEQCGVSLGFSAHVTNRQSKGLDNLALERTLVGFEGLRFPL